MKILVLIPMKPNMNPELRKLSETRAIEMHNTCGRFVQVVIDDRGTGDAHIEIPRTREESRRQLQVRTQHTSGIRNALIDDYLEDSHTHVLWIDADVIEYTSLLPIELAVLSNVHNAVVAPAIYLHKKWVDNFEQGTSHRRWYDTAGFVKNGEWFSPGFPYYRDQALHQMKDHANLVECESVGCVYIVPAAVFQKGARFQRTEGFTEHMSICRAAKTMGIRSIVWFDRYVEHAYLPDYGEANH